MSRFDAKKRKRLRGFQALPVWARPAIYGAGVLLAALFIFQLFFRYQYLETNGVLWRLDRLTQQTCQVDMIRGACVVPKISSSTSTSTSTSTSVSLKGAGPKKKH